ncbi:hypothetical protein BDW60DRAFT_198761 [Aspergillus nidulans var. acristatus]
MFVGGPTLNEQSGNVRSTLLRRVLAEKKTKQREDAASKLDSMLKSRAKGRVQGPEPSSGLGSWPGIGPGRGSAPFISSVCRCGSGVEPREGVRAGLDLRELGLGLGLSLEASQAMPANHRTLRPEHGQDGLGTSGMQGPTLTLQTSGRCPTCGRAQTLPAASAAASVSHLDDQLLALRSPQLLGAGRSDPLLPLDATASRLKVHELLDFTTTTLWPQFRAQDYAGSCYRSWVYPLEESNKLLLYAVLWAASYHRDILRITYGAAKPQLESKEQLELKSLVLQELQKEVANISETNSPDALVMCILYLAVNDRHKTRIQRDPSPFAPPFMDLQALDFYGSRDYHPLHWKVVHDIVQRFGGIRNLRVFALAWLLCLSDLMSAMQNLTKPLYPILGVDAKPLDLQPPSLLFRGIARETAGSGFHDLFYIWPPIRQELVSVFIHLGQYSSVIQHYAASGESCSPAVLDLLGDSRNLIHHRLLSQADENDPTEAIIQCKGQTDAETDLSREIYLTVRLSAILYAVHVTFPLPRSQPVRESLLKALYPRLDKLCTHNVSQPVILWCVAVAMSMLSMPDKIASAPSALVSYMARLSQDAGVDSSDKLVALLESFAWVDAAVQYTEISMWKRVVP